MAILKGESAIASPSDRQEENATTVNALVDTWRNSPSWKELDRILSSAEPGEDEELTTRDLYERLNEALKKSLAFKDERDTSATLCTASILESLALLHDHGNRSDSAVSPRQGDVGISIRTVAGGILSSHIPIGGSSNLLQDWSQLLDIYFANTNCWIPIVLKNDAFRAAYTISHESDSNVTSQLSLGDHACLLSILAYARYTQCIATGKNGSWQDMQGHFNNLFTRASQLIATYESRRDVGHVQAMLVFTLLHYAQGNLGLAWSFVGRAVYHAVELGLLKSGVTQSPPLDDRSKRAVLSCFVLETLLSARLHRRPYMRTSDVQSVGLLDADGIEEWEPWRPTGLSSSASACDPPRPSHQPARILSTFNLLVETSTVLNDKLQNDTDGKTSQETFDASHLFEAQHRLDKLVSQSEARGASPQALNLMLSTLACISYPVSTGADGGDSNRSRPSHINLDVHRILAHVSEGVKHQGAVTLSPVADAYLHIIEGRNGNTTSSSSQEVLDSIKSVREIRAMYNETWRNSRLGPGDPVQAIICTQAETMAAPNVPSGVLGEGSKTQPGSRNQSPVTRFMEPAASGAVAYAPRAPSAFVPLQREG